MTSTQRNGTCSSIATRSIVAEPSTDGRSDDRITLPSLDHAQRSSEDSSSEAESRANDDIFWYIDPSAEHHHQALPAFDVNARRGLTDLHLALHNTVGGGQSSGSASSGQTTVATALEHGDAPWSALDRHRATTLPSSDVLASMDSVALSVARPGDKISHRAIDSGARMELLTQLGAWMLETADPTPGINADQHGFPTYPVELVF